MNDPTFVLPLKTKGTQRVSKAKEVRMEALAQLERLEQIQLNWWDQPTVLPWCDLNSIRLICYTSVYTNPANIAYIFFYVFVMVLSLVVSKVLIIQLNLRDYFICT